MMDKNLTTIATKVPICLEKTSIVDKNVHTFTKKFIPWVEKENAHDVYDFKNLID